MNLPVEIHPEGKLLGDKFRVVRLLGIGGMGAVYEVENEKIKKRCALKLLHIHERVSPEAVERFKREATADGRIGNAHVVEISDAGVLASGEPYMAMELLAGETLASLIKRKGPLDLAEICDLVGQACDGVQAAHDAGVIHRDLKPANLFVTSGEEKPFVKLLDFGISKFDAGTPEDMGSTREGTILGTPSYMSPEQIRGEADVDARSDVYSMGVILYECAAGNVPFRAEDLQLLRTLICEGKTDEYLKALPTGLPETFRDLLVHTMAVDREHRPPSARELGEKLRAIGAPIGVGPAPVPLPEPQPGGPIPDLMGSTEMIAPIVLPPPDPYLRDTKPPAPAAPAQASSAPRFPIWAVIAALAVGAVGATTLRSGVGDAGSGSAPVASSTLSKSGEPAATSSSTTSSSAQPGLTAAPTGSVNAAVSSEPSAKPSGAPPTPKPGSSTGSSSTPPPRQPPPTVPSPGEDAGLARDP